MYKRDFDEIGQCVKQQEMYKQNIGLFCAV